MGKNKRTEELFNSFLDRAVDNTNDNSDITEESLYEEYKQIQFLIKLKNLATVEEMTSKTKVRLLRTRKLAADNNVVSCVADLGSARIY